MPDTFRIGPARILVASSITEPVENWTDLGITRGDVAVEPRVRIAVGRPDQTAATPRSDAVYRVGEIATTRAPMLDKALTLLQKQYPASAIVTASGKTSLALDNKIGAVSGVAIAVVPIDVYVEGQAWWASDYTVWIPSGIFRVGGDLKHELPAEGDDGVAASVREVEIVSTRSAAGVPASVQGAGGIGQLWLNGLGALGLDLLLEHTFDTATTPLIGGAGTFTRASTAVEKSRADGKYRSVANNVLRDEANGWLIEPQRTNKCQRNYLHGGATTGWVKLGDAAATLTAVLDAAELAAAGLDVLCADNYVLKLDNSAGVALASARATGSAGNTNTHAVSAFVRGSGNAMVRTNSAGPGYSPLTASYVRREHVFAPGGVGDAIDIEAAAGAIVYFVLAQFEEGAFATSPIPNNTAGSVTRNSDTWSFGGVEAIDANGISIQAAFRPLFSAPAASHLGYLFAYGSPGSNPAVGVLFNGAAEYQIYLTDASGNVYGSLVGEAFTQGTLEELTTIYDPALVNKWAAFEGDVDKSPATAGKSPSGTPSASIYVGGESAGNALGCRIVRFVVCRGIAAATVAGTPALLRQLKRSA